MPTLSPTPRFATCLLLLGSALPGLASAVCAAPELIAPRGPVLTPALADTRPRIAWSAVDGADAYSLQLRSRVPEGRLIATYDVLLPRTQLYFLPAAALATQRAKLTVVIAAHCGQERSAPRSAWFLIDASLACATPATLAVRAKGAHIAVTWSASASADSYELRLHAPDDGHLLASYETRAAQLTLQAAAPGAQLSLRARCGDRYGDMVYAAAASG